jgi:hypothetical protein
MPWGTMAEAPTIHRGLFVHRVTGLEPGLYLLVREPTKIGSLNRAMHPRFDWSTPPGCVADLPLRMLEAGDARRLAPQLSCHQDIAGDGAFSLAMITEYQEALFTHKAWFYRRLVWEAGLIGQVLYLEAEAEAEAAGVRATGIGCYFDDPVYRTFGIEDLAYQSLYHASPDHRSSLRDHYRLLWQPEGARSAHQGRRPASGKQARRVREGARRGTREVEQGGPQRRFATAVRNRSLREATGTREIA